MKFLDFTPSFVCSTMIQTLCDDNAGCAVFIMTCSYSLGSRGSTGGVVTMAHNWLFVVDTRTMPTAKSHTSGTPSCCPGRPEGESAPKLVDPQCKDGRSSWTCADSIILWTKKLKLVKLPMIQHLLTKSPGSFLLKFSQISGMSSRVFLLCFYLWKEYFLLNCNFGSYGDSERTK